MAYLGRKGASAALTSSDIPDGSISAVKVAADVATQAEIDLKANLASPTLTTPNLGPPSAVTLTNATFPSGKVNNVFRLIDNTSGEYQANVDSSAAKVPANAMSWSATSGRHYLVNSQSLQMPWANGTSSSGRTQTTRLYVGTTNRSEGDTQASTSTDTLLFDAYVGRNLTAATTTGDHGYWLMNMQGFFTAGSTATHYVYLTIHSTTAINSRFGGASTAQPWTVIIYEIMP